MSSLIIDDTEPLHEAPRSYSSIIELTLESEDDEDIYEYTISENIRMDNTNWYSLKPQNIPSYAFSSTYEINNNDMPKIDYTEISVITSA